MKITDIWNQKNLVRICDNDSLSRKMAHLTEWESAHQEPQPNDPNPSPTYQTTKEHINLIERLVNGE